MNRQSALVVWSQIPIANRTITLPAGSYSVHASSNQRGTINVASAGSVTATISSVTTTRSRCGYGGNDSQDDNVAKGVLRVALTNATTVTADCGVATSTLSRLCWEVEETY